MATKKLKLDRNNIVDASSIEIREFAASEEIGLEFAEDASRSYMIEMIFETTGWMRLDQNADATHVVVKIPRSAGENGSQPYRGGFNGRMFSIKRDEEVEIPIEYYNTIMDTNGKGFVVKPLVKGSPVEGSPASDRLMDTSYPVQAIRFINKGKKTQKAK